MPRDVCFITGAYMLVIHVKEPKVYFILFYKTITTI